MRYITDPEELEQTKHYMKIAAEVARNSKCKKSQRGVIIVKDNEIISKGYNKPMKDDCCLRERIKDNSHVELCNAVHAEDMAIGYSDNSKEQLKGARMYHIKLKNGEMMPSGKPSCTMCSKLVQLMGLEFVLWHEEGYTIYQPEEFNEMSFDYFLKK